MWYNDVCGVELQFGAYQLESRLLYLELHVAGLLQRGLQKLRRLLQERDGAILAAANAMSRSDVEEKQGAQSSPGS